MGLSFISEHAEQFHKDQGVAVSRTTPDNPQSAGQCERYNYIILKTIQLLANNKGISMEHWDQLFPEAQYIIRTLLGTGTNWKKRYCHVFTFLAVKIKNDINKTSSAPKKKTRNFSGPSGGSRCEAPVYANLLLKRTRRYSFASKLGTDSGWIRTLEPQGERTRRALSGPFEWHENSEFWSSSFLKKTMKL